MIRSVSLLALGRSPLAPACFMLALAGTLWPGAAHAQMSESDLLMRIDHLESQLRDLTGTVEQLQYRNHELEQELQRVQGPAPGAAAPPRPTAQYSPPSYSPPSYSPSPYAPAPASARQYSSPATGTAQYAPPTPPYAPPPAPAVASAVPGAPGSPGVASGRHGDAFDPSLDPSAPGAPRALGTSTMATEPPPPVADAGGAAPGGRQYGAPLDLSAPPGAEGALPPPPPANTSDTGAMQAMLPPNSTPKDQYDLAYGYVLHKDYGPAAETFRDFLHKYPSDRLAPEAQYWLGESLFQSQQYRDAAESFLAVSTKYDTTARAPDALLRLGQSLAALGEKEAACASLGEVLRKYPHASINVKQSVDREQKRVHC